MKRLLCLLVIVVMLMGCVSLKNYQERSDIPPRQAEQDVIECNSGWEACMIVDILLTIGIASLIHYSFAQECMTRRGYIPKPVDDN